MRSLFLFTAATLVGAGVISFNQSTQAEPAAKKADPWVGTYVKYSRYDPGHQGQFGQIKITKDADGYHLSRYPYSLRTLTEVKKGVLSDGPGGLGKIYLGSMEFVDGKRGRVLRAEFCYENFLLYGGLDPSAR
jgi:hypothetical protein